MWKADNYLEQLARGLEQLSPRVTVPLTGSPGESLVLIIDHSGSMDAPCGRVNRLKAAQEAVIACLDARNKSHLDDIVALIAFDHEATLVLPFTPCRGHRPRIDTAIRSLTTDGGTDLRKPLILANQIWEHQINAHIVLLSDGHDSDDPTRAARRLKDRGAIVETIGVGNDPSEVNERVLKKVASVLDGKVLYRFIRDADEMNTYFRTEVANRLLKRNEP